MKNYLIILSLFLLIACQNKSTQANKKNYKQEIENLKTDEQKNDFLYNLWQEDQNYRGGKEGKIVQQYGQYSDEHKAFIKKFKSNDNEVFLKLKTYLEIHGYPKNKAAYHELAINAFPIIIGHNHNYPAQEELLPYIYQAYKDKYCSLEDVVWILGEMHESAHQGRRYEMSTNRYTLEQEFEELVKALGLDLELS